MIKFKSNFYKLLYFTFTIVLFLGIFQKQANAYLSNSREIQDAGYINKETIKKADLICIGKVDLKFKSIKIKKGTYEIKKSSSLPKGKTMIVKGNWYMDTILVKAVIKGKLTTNRIPLTIFFPNLKPMDYNFSFFDSPRPTLVSSSSPNYNPLSLLFLKKDTDGTYSLVNRVNSLIILPYTKIPNLSHIKTTKDKLKTILLACIKNGNNFSISSTLYTLKQIGLSSKELILTLRQVTQIANPEIKGDIISERISLGDKKDSLKDILALSENKKYSQINFDPLSYMSKLTNPEYIPILVKILNSENESLKQGAIMALSSIKDKSVVPYLIKALDDKNNFVKFSAVYGLTNILGPMRKNGKFISGSLNNPNKNGLVDLWKNWWKMKGEKEYNH